MPQDPKVIQEKLKSPEGEVYKVELTRYGQMIAEKEYELQKLKCYETHCRLRFQEFLGTELTAEQQEQMDTLSEWIGTWEEQNNVKQGEKAKCQ